MLDTGCDQSVVCENSFHVTKRHSKFYRLYGALNGMESSTNLELVDACTLVTLQTGDKYILQMNQSLLDSNPSATESLFQPYQGRASGVIIDDVARRHAKSMDGTRGTQSISAGKHTLPLHFDGLKKYFSIRKPSPFDLDKYPTIELTSSQPYTPHERMYTRRVTPSPVTDEEWRRRLCYPTMQVTRKTLENTTQMVNTVEAETREYMRDHLRTRLPMLRPIRINDTCYHDVFFSSIRSIRGYKCFLVNALLNSAVDDVRLMKREAEVDRHFLDFIRQVGAPNISVTDNAKVFTSEKWTDILRKYCIDDGFTEAYHQNGNPAERRGGDLKVGVLKVFQFTPWAPVRYWCYLLEHLTFVRSFYARKKLDWRTGRQVLRGETQDISVIRFAWFQPVFYYDPKKSFPSNKMLPGFFLGIDPSVGDTFSFLVLPVKDTKDIPTNRLSIKPLIRSVVRSRDINITEEDYPICDVTVDSIVIHDRDGNVLPGDVNDLETEQEDIIPPVVTPPHSEEPTDQLTEPDSIELTFQSSQDGTPHEEELPAALPPVHVTASPQPMLPTTDPRSAVPISPDNADHPANVFVADEEYQDGPVIVEDVITDDEMDDENPISSDTFGENDRIAQNLNNAFANLNDNANEDADSDFEIDDIVDYRYVEGCLELQVLFMNGSKDFVHWEIVREDDPKIVAEYILDTDFKNKIQNGILQRWARKFLRSLKRTMRRLFSVDYHRHTAPSSSEEPIQHSSCLKYTSAKRRDADTTSYIRRATQKKRKKPGRNNRHMGNFKYGHEVPNTYKDVVRLDDAAGTKQWHEAIAKEIAALLHHGCFDFKQAGYKPPRDYQRAPLKMVYDVKPDGRFKARLVVQGCRIDSRGLSTRATVVKSISVRTLDIIAEHFGLEVKTGDIGNAFIQALTKEKCYVECGPEFGTKAGLIAIIRKALYGLTTSAERFRTLLADFLRSLGFVPTRFDRDVWMRLREEEDGYDYVCTHVDDFKIVARNPDRWLEQIKATFLVKESGPRGYYLGNDYTHHPEHGDLWTYGSQTYTKEAIRKVESTFGVLAKQKTALPPVTTANKVANHPETDTSPLLNEKGHRQFQMLLGMMQWLCLIGRPDLCNATASLSRFGACPRVGHLDLALHVFGFLKMHDDRQIAIDAKPLDYKRTAQWQQLKIDFAMDYPEAKEEIDPKFPKAFGKPLQTTIMVDADHAHDLVTRRSLTGLIAYIGSTPVLWLSKRQGAIAASTYAAEFYALRVATEEAVNLRYMLRAFGVNVVGATQVFGDNLSVITNSVDPEADLKKKHVALSFHVVREAVAAGVIEPYWVKGKFNTSDIMTKQLCAQESQFHNNSIFWKPGKHIRTANNLDAEMSPLTSTGRRISLRGRRVFCESICPSYCLCRKTTK